MIGGLVGRGDVIVDLSNNSGRSQWWGELTQMVPAEESGRLNNGRQWASGRKVCGQLRRNRGA